VVAGERRQPLVLWNKFLVECLDSPLTSYSISLEPAAFGIEIGAGVSVNVPDIYPALNTRDLNKVILCI